MKKILSVIVVLALAVVLLPACKRYTEITPKGSSLLNRVSDLDMLLNYNFTASVAAGDTLSAKSTAQAAFSAYDVGTLVNDTYPYSINVPSLISSKQQSLNYALTVYDEAVDRKTLAVTDIKYEKIYFIINNVCNVVLKQADNASGDRTKANQLKAEAYILRAYLHYLLVNFYAKGYNAATAATDGGIPYVKEDNVVTTPNTKSTVAEVYANIQADIKAAFALNSLPKIPVNNMRVGLGFAYAVQAQVLITVRDFAGALAAANQSLAINSTINDDRLFGPVGSLTFAKPMMTAPENLFYMGYQGNPLISTPSLEITNNYYEPGNIIDSYVKPYYPGDNPFSAVPGSRLWLYSAATYAINTAGMTTSDTYLIKAECLARAGDLGGALSIINLIRQNRIHPSVYADVSAGTEGGVMALLMKTFRIEGLYSMHNFLNIKRWNTDDVYKQTISRTLFGVTYSLKPESSLWIFPFPQSATSYNPDLTQNY